METICLHQKVRSCCAICTPGYPDELKAEIRVLSDQLSQISEAVLGYREGRIDDILSGLKTMKEKAQQHEMNQNVQEVFELVDQLTALKEDILHDVT